MEKNEGIVEETIVDNDETVGNEELQQEGIVTEEQTTEGPVTNNTDDSDQGELIQESEQKPHSRMYTEEEYQKQ